MTAQPTPDGHLPAARNRLDHAISALIDPKPHVIDREDGTKPITWLDPVYTQLRDAIAGQTGERSGRHTTSPIWTDVHDLITEIDQAVTKWHPNWPQMADPALDHTEPTIVRLQALRARKWRVEDTDHVQQIAATLESFTTRAQDILAPEPAVYLTDPNNPGPAACTACGTRRVWRKDPTNPAGRVMQPALKVTAHGCICQACKTRWEPGQLRMLAAALGYPLPQGVLE